MSGDGRAKTGLMLRPAPAVVTASVRPAHAPLGRTCGCGQHATTGVCAACRERTAPARPAITRSSERRRPAGLGPQFPYDFSGVEPEPPRSGSDPEPARSEPGQETGAMPGGSDGPAPPRRHLEVLERMEAAFGMSFDGVRLRTDPMAAARAESLDARAYTDGREIGFAAGAFAPETRQGLHTIAHEFAHIAQARGGTGGRLLLAPASIGAGAVRCQTTTSRPPMTADPVEEDAEQAVRRVVEGEEPEVAPAVLACTRARRRSPSRSLRSTEDSTTP